jgi:hypothetical protein
MRLVIRAVRFGLSALLLSVVSDHAHWSVTLSLALTIVGLELIAFILTGIIRKIKDAERILRRLERIS